MGTQKSPSVASRPTVYDAKQAERRDALRTILDALDDEAKPRAQDLVRCVRWLSLANELGVSLHTVQHWARRGYLPRSQALAVENRYGRKLVKSEDLYRPAAV